MPVNEVIAGFAPISSPIRPRLGFLGLGWIGGHRLRAILDADLADVVAICDTCTKTAERAAALKPGIRQVGSIDELLREEVQGIVIATPTALHAEQSIRALSSGVAVFCQKPLGRTAAEVRAVVDAARQADRLLAVDLSYRFTAGMRRISELARTGELGCIYAIDLVFHNAYGPDKEWFYDVARAGGGCAIDLGVHLVDIALWTLGYSTVSDVRAELFAGGKAVEADSQRGEDYAVATFRLGEKAIVRLACSWRLQAGCDAEISATFYGTQGGARLRNVNGSFYDFIAERFRGTAREVLSEPPDAWFGRASVEWTRQLINGGGRFDHQAEQLVAVADVLDRIYGR